MIRGAQVRVLPGSLLGDRRHRPTAERMDGPHDLGGRMNFGSVVVEPGEPVFIGLGLRERFACRAAGRDLTPAEWPDVLPDRAYRPVCPV